MSIKVFAILLIAFMAIAVQAATPSHFLSAQQAKALEGNTNLAEFLLSSSEAGSGETSSTGSEFTVSSGGEGSVDVDFAVYDTYVYYFAIQETSSITSAPGAQDTADGVGNFVGTSVSADGSVTFDGLDASTEYTVWVSAKDSSGSVYPSDGVAQEAGVASTTASVPVISNFDFEVDAEGDFTAAFDSNVAGSWIIETYYCCGIRGLPDCGGDCYSPEEFTTRDEYDAATVLDAVVGSNTVDASNTAIDFADYGSDTVVVPKAMDDLTNLVVALRAPASDGLIGPLFSGNVIKPGYWDWGAAATLSHVVTFDAEGDADAVFVIRINGAFATAALSSTALINGAQSCNIFWVINGAVAFGANTIAHGNFIAAAGAMTCPSVLDGRLLSTAGAIASTGSSFAPPSAVSKYIDIGCLQSFVFFTSAGALACDTSGNYGNIGQGAGAIAGFADQNGKFYDYSTSDSTGCATESTVEYQVILYLFGADGDVTTTYNERFTLPDDTAPVLTAEAGTVDGSSVEVVATFDDSDTIVFVAVVEAGATAPTADEIILAGNTETVVSGLADSSDYIVYAVGVSSGGVSEVVSFEVTTADETAPIISSVSVTEITRDSASLTVVSDDDSASIYYLSSNESVVYSADNLLNSGILFDGTSLVLEPDTTYTLSIVAIDASDNTNFVVETVVFTTEPLYPTNTEIYAIVEDTYAFEDDVTHGNDASLIVSSTSAILIQTDVPTDVAGAGPLSSSVTIYGGIDGETYTLAAITEAWTEAGATSVCAASQAGQCVNADWDIVNGGSAAASSVSATAVDGKVVFDVTDEIAAIFDGAENFGWVITTDSSSDSTFGSSESGQGPELALVYHEDVATGSVTFGPICEGYTGSISCASGVISINAASYGRHNTVQCPYRGGSWAMRNTMCHASNSVSIVSETCNGKSECTLTSKNNVFGDPCRGTYKYLEGAYTCVAEISDDFCSGFTASEAQTSCVSSAYGPVYTCGDLYEGIDCSEVIPTYNVPLVAFLSFDDESGLDLTGNGNDGNDIGTVTYVQGVNGQAASFGVDFEGSYQAIEISESLDFTTDFSACAWIAASDVSAGQSAVPLSAGQFAGVNEGFGIYINSDNRFNSGARISVRFDRENGRQSISQAFVDDGSFHFVCAVFTNAVQSLYVDGHAVTETRFAGHGSIIAPTSALTIGSDVDTEGYGFQGALDNVRIYNTALTSAEVSVLFSSDGGLQATEIFFDADNTDTDEDDVDDVCLDASKSGCADGSREGFIGAENIAACYGGWDIPGVATPESFERQCSGQSGNDGQIEGCSVQDTCAVGWHVCASAEEVKTKSGSEDGCNAFNDFEKGFFVTRQSGPGSYRQESTGANDVFGCGDGASIAPRGTPNGLQVFTHNKCSRVDKSFKCQGNGRGYDEAFTITHNSNEGGALCCKDDREINSGSNKRGVNRQCSIKVRGKGHDEEFIKRLTRDVETEYNNGKAEGRRIRAKAVRMRSGRDNRSRGKKSRRRGKRMLLEDEEEYTYIVVDIEAGADSDGNELSDINEIIVSSSSSVSVEYDDLLAGYADLYTCEDGSVRESCEYVELREETELPAGTIGDGYETTEASSVGNSSDIVTAVIITAVVFVLVIAAGFAYRAKTAKNVGAEFDARIMNSAASSEDVELSSVKKEQDTYWVFNKSDVRVVV